MPTNIAARQSVGLIEGTLRFAAVHDNKVKRACKISSSKTCQNEDFTYTVFLYSVFVI